jgi:catechol 2,3-dioxygenase-like lactoylglutathione lyase family enzyme
MLGDHLVFPILLSTDMAASRSFYHDTLGLEILREDEERLIVRCGPSRIVVTSSTVGTKDSQTQLAWLVPDLHAALDDLRARGVPIEQYVAPDPATDEDGIADMGYAWAAWIIDPSGNCLGLIEVKPAPAS